MWRTNTKEVQKKIKVPHNLQLEISGVTFLQELTTALLLILCQRQRQLQLAISPTSWILSSLFFNIQKSLQKLPLSLPCLCYISNHPSNIWSAIYTHEKGLVTNVYWTVINYLIVTATSSSRVLEDLLSNSLPPYAIPQTLIS